MGGAVSAALIAIALMMYGPGRSMPLLFLFCFGVVFAMMSAIRLFRAVRRG